MKWIRRLFWIAGVYGLLVLAPQYFMERRIGINHPPAINHPEYFYGFIGVALAWQVAFLVVATDPIRFRPLIIPSAVEKLSFATAGVLLFAWGRVPLLACIFAVIDFLVGILFLIAFVQLGNLTRNSDSPELEYYVKSNDPRSPLENDNR